MQLIFFLLTRSMLERPPKDDMERWTTIAWAIWRARNKFCFEDFQPRLEAILRKVTSFLHEYQTLVANQWTHQLFEGMGVMIIFFFLFFFFVLGVRLVCIVLEHIRPLLIPLYFYLIILIQILPFQLKKSYISNYNSNKNIFHPNIYIIIYSFIKYICNNFLFFTLNQYS